MTGFDMSSAMFRTLVETMGMERAWIAGELGVSDRTVRRWFSPRTSDTVPEFASVWVLSWWERFQDLVSDAVGGVLDLEDDADGRVEVAELARFRSQESADRAGIDMPLSMHSALLGLVAFGLTADDVVPVVRWRAEEP